MFQARLIILFFTILSISCVSSYQEKDYQGKIFNVDLEKRSFELLKRAEYDPSTNEGRSRFKVRWNEKTKFTSSVYMKNFAGLDGTFWADFHPNNTKRLEHMMSGRSFKIFDITIYAFDTKKENLPSGPKSFLCQFRPESNNSGKMILNGKEIEVTLHEKRAKIKAYFDSYPEITAQGLWECQMRAVRQDDTLTANSIFLESVPDPRKSDDPSLPRILIIGDSISMNYHESAKKALEGTANYHRINENSGPSNRGVESVDLWLGNYKKKGLHWDVIQFNHGLHDLKQSYNSTDKSWGSHQVSIDDYKANLEKIIQSLKKTGATIIWCETTPVQNSMLGKYARRKGESAVFNKAALEVIKKHPDILVNELHKSITESKIFDKWRKGHDVHFYRQEEKDFLGQKVADTVIKALKLRNDK